MHKRDVSQRVFIVAELHPQHGGEVADLHRMMLQAKLGGADAVKVQLYDTQTLHGDETREYLQINWEELTALKEYADRLEIELFASIFDKQRLGWCEDLGFKMYKIASRTVADIGLCDAIIATGKPVFISLGNYAWETKGLPYSGAHLVYFYCVSKYPTLLDDISMPTFSSNHFLGYSDHSIGIAACVYAVSRGARYLEKHFSLSKARQSATEKAHLGAMDFEELSQLRALADDMVTLREKGIG